MFRAGLIAILLLVLLAAASCGGGSSIAALDTEHIVSAELDRSAGVGAEGAEVVLVPRGDGEYELHADSLQDAKVLVGSVSYDPQRSRLLLAQVGETDASNGTVGDDRLSLFVDRPEEGRVHFSMALRDYPNRRGLHGRTLLARLRFGRGPAPQTRRVSTPPTGAANINSFTLEGEVDQDGHAVLTWKDTIDGDGDNNGEVNASDIAPIAAQYRFKPDPDSTDPEHDRGRNTDYDRNGEINASDLAVIAGQFRVTLGGYQILAGSPGGTLSEVEKFARNVMFPDPPSTADGELFWEWRSAAPLAEETEFQVRPYDNTPAIELGRASDNTVTLEPLITDPTITGVTIEFDDPDGKVIDLGGGVLQLIVTELSVDEQIGNAEPFATELLQLRAMGETAEDPGNPIDVTEEVVWVITAGGGLANVSTTAGSRGRLTPRDRGAITVEAHVAGNFLINDTISFQLATIESIELTSGGGAGPVNVAPGTDVPFTAMGLFDSDNDPGSGNESTLDITAYVNWAQLQAPTNAGTFSIETTDGTLSTNDAVSGDTVSVSAEFPRTDTVTLHDYVKRYSPFVTVNVT